MIFCVGGLSSIWLIVTVTMINNKYFHFTFVAPNALRRLVHMNTVTRIVFEMDGTMIIVVLRTANVEASFC